MKLNDDNFDAAVDAKIADCLSLVRPVSFFMFAGAGSGKTKSLVAAINHIIQTNKGEYREFLSLHAKFVGVITYTKAATNEILKRTKFDTVVKVSTIHSFAWGLIEGFNEDIKSWLEEKLEGDLEKLALEQSKARSSTNKTSIGRGKKIVSKKKRLEGLSAVRKFSYNPDGGSSDRDSLAHSEVIGIAARLLSTNEVMQRILVNRFPFLLIDESQDTNADLMEAFMKVQENHRGSFALGLFGDTMQRIYNDGKSDLGQNLPSDWETPVKSMNHRCPPRIVDLINKVRMTTDQQQQRPRSDRGEGLVRLFLAGTGSDRMAIEKSVAEQMAIIAQDDAWKEHTGVKRLILEHHMASNRMGFTEMFKPLYDVEKLRTGLLDGSLSAIQFFARYLLPVVDGDEFTTTSTVRDHSPLLNRKKLRKNQGLREKAIGQCQEAVAKLNAICGEGNDPTFGDILLLVAETGLFVIPESLQFFVSPPEAKDQIKKTGEGEFSGEESRLLDSQRGLEQFLSSRFSQLRPYLEYVSGEGGLDTHQGVKGLQFPRVMVIMDDSSARGWQFSYERLFGAKGPSKSNKPTEDPDRTKRLFYVTCSRAEESLALVAYSENPTIVRNNVIKDGWFTEGEVVSL